MKKNLLKKLLLCTMLTLFSFFSACSDLPTSTTSTKTITISEWLEAKGNISSWTMVVEIKTIVNPALAIVTDKSNKEVNLFGVNRGNTFIDFSSLQASVGDTLIIGDGKYNEYQGSIEIKDCKLLEYLPIEKTITADYDFTYKSAETVMGETFDNDIVLVGYKGMIRFINCTFNGNVTLIGGENAKVMIWEDCTFATEKKCIIISSVIESTLKTQLPKFLIFCSMPEIICINSGAAVGYSTQDITFNGNVFKTNTSTYFIDEEVGEDVINAYSNQQADMHNVCIYQENNIIINVQTAVQTVQE